MSTSVDALPDIASEKLSIMKIRAGDYGRESLSEPTTPTNLRSSSLERSSLAKGSRSTLTRRTTSRSSSGSARRSNSFLHSHRSQMSMELTSQAEKKFFALMDLMSTASREASSLKEVWARITSERDTLYREKEELLARVEEVTEFFEHKESEHHQHGQELTERKFQVDKLIHELSAALGTVADQKKKIADSEHRLQRAHNELEEIGSTMSRSHTSHEKTRAELESTILKLKAAEDERDHAREDSHRHHTDLKTLLREHTDLKSKYTEASTKLEFSRKEVSSFTDRIKIWELERDEYLHEKDRLQEEVKRARVRADEASRELFELTERHDRVQRDSTKLKETVRTVETERDDHALSVENLRRELKAKATGWEESDQRCADITLKYEQVKREVVSIKEKLRDVELERSELRDSIDRTHEEHRTILVERNQLKEDVSEERRKVSTTNRQLAVVQESLRRAEQALAESRADQQALADRNKLLLSEVDDHRAKHTILVTDLSNLREKLALSQTESRTLAEAQDRVRAELSQWKSKYEEVSETITEYKDDSGELECEIEHLRSMLREAREQKERAISARHAADRERDEYVSKYEEKCRELERWEERGEGHLMVRRSSGGERKSSFTRSVSSGTTVHNGVHSHSSVEGTGMLRVP